MSTALHAMQLLQRLALTRHVEFAHAEQTSRRVGVSTPQASDWRTTDPVQAAVYDAFMDEMQGPWVWLSRSIGEPLGQSVGQYSALLKPEYVETMEPESGWDVFHGDGGPGFVQYYEDGKPRTVFERVTTDAGEVLVQDRTWHGVRPGDVELAEEFRLLFNLWEDRRTRTYYSFDESGNPVKAAVIAAEGVRVLSKLVRRYQAAKQMFLALFLDATLWSDDLPRDKHSWDLIETDVILSYYRGEISARDRPFSRLVGKRLLAPPPIETCGMWPFESERSDYVEFIIGTTPLGDEISFTSNPGALANYFGANPDSPHYLTSVYFRREVLNKYYADPERFSIEDGYLRCAGLWGLRMDNDQAGHIGVFLGDLGRDIPAEEAQYWRTFNILPPEEGPSETLVRRAFGGQFADPKSPDLRFPRVYRDTNTAWKKAFGQPLFLPLHQDDQHVLGKLHVPVTDGAAEFDEQILYLTKLLVDSLNEESLVATIGKGPADERGLAKLERFLTVLGVDGARALLTPLARVQGLRSRGAAHRKGSSFDISTALGDLGRRDGFEALLIESIATLEKLRDIAAEHRPEG
jgi:hypothetical protein